MLNFYETDLFPLQVFEQNGQWKYRYQLDADHRGEVRDETFTYTVRDGFRGSATASITINLDDANTAPVLSGDLSASIGGSIDRYEGGLVREEGQLAWHDVDGDAITSVSIGGVTLPAAGSVSIAGQYGALHLTMQAGGASYVYTLKEGLDSQGIRAVDSFAIVVAEITAALPTALFDDFSFLASSDPTAAPDAHAPQENADPAPAEPVAIDLVNVPLPHDVDAAQSIA